MQYSIVVETPRGDRYVYDRRSSAPPVRLDLHFALVDSPNANRTIAPSLAFAKELKLALLANQRALGVSQVMHAKCIPYEGAQDDRNCEIACGYCPICGLDDGTR